MSFSQLRDTTLDSVSELLKLVKFSFSELLKLVKFSINMSRRVPLLVGLLLDEMVACIQKVVEETVRQLVPSRGSREGSSVSSIPEGSAASTQAPASGEPNLLGNLSCWGGPD